jgi:hypothetical protein
MNDHLINIDYNTGWWTAVDEMASHKISLAIPFLVFFFV